MKKLLAYLGVFIVITGLLLLFVINNYPNNVVEVCLKNSYNKEQIEEALEKISVYDYLNIYDIFSNEENASVYFGNINILLNSNKTVECGITFDDKEVIMGDKFMRERFNYNLLGEIYKSSYGEYDVNCVIKGSNRIYYRDLNALKNSDIKNQRKSKNYCKKLLSKYRASKYDIDIKSFIKKDGNYRLMLSMILVGIMQLLIAITVLYLTIKFTNIKLSYSVDYTSLKSITESMKSFFKLIEYYITNGFTNISLMIIKIIFIYVLTSVVLIASCKRKYGR